ncbi:hydroxymethylglutaryl-CoA lyase [Desulfosediminicola ganghwensis]|uniref:hydroxymethylglutaryl-CoA lyase n=1 Tax=Desulfosediminicola ganghwensis TaxID=2569540 RepID=UPI0010ABD896|nr:hydroxymethylglutaryl-CoA lyase [Desulfosediminicola ganghwensis]
MNLPERVKIVEVSPRDGLQNEELTVQTSAKLEYIDHLVAAGLPVVEATSWVPADHIPQLADHAEVIAGLKSQSQPSQMVVLVPNLYGARKAIAAGAAYLSIMASASERFSEKNNNCTIREGLERCAEIAKFAKSEGVPVRGYVSCTLGCPYEGEVALSRVVEVTGELYSLGCEEIALSDTIGVGTPGKVEQMIRAVCREVPVHHLAVHFHDSYGQALANIYAALQLGVQTVDSSVAGLGGCPYAHGATGNVATEDLIYMLNGLGIETGVDLSQLVEAGRYICWVLQKTTNSKVARVLLQE